MHQSLHIDYGRKEVAPAAQNHLLPLWAVAWRFDDEGQTHYQMWPIRFQSAKQAEDWIQREYPLSPQWNISWVILEVA